MLEIATVTLSYKEFKELIDKAESAEKNEKLIEKLIKERDEEKPMKTLDNIVDLISSAFSAKEKEKQEYIKKGIECYCNAFEIPIEELI